MHIWIPCFCISFCIWDCCRVSIFKHAIESLEWHFAALINSCSRRDVVSAMWSCTYSEARKINWKPFLSCSLCARSLVRFRLYFFLLDCVYGKAAEPIHPYLKWYISINPQHKPSEISIMTLICSFMQCSFWWKILKQNVKCIYTKVHSYKLFLTFF